MPNTSFQLQYDEMTSIAKNFKDEGEDIVQLHAATRQRVQDLYDEWVGEGAEKFFEEMETTLLPALQRLANALFESQDVSTEVMKIIQGADEETAGFFRNELAGDDFGAGLFGQASQGIQGGSSSSSDDFGAGKFGEVLGNPAGDSSVPGTPGDVTPPQEAAQETPVTEQVPPEEPQVEETASSAGGGGGGGSGSSQGLQGDLGKMGAGLVNDAPSQNASSGGGGTSGPVNMPDHVYSGSDSPSPAGDQSGSGVSAGGSGDSGGSSSEAGTAAGIAGVAGGAAAAGSGAKVLKKKKQEGS